MYTGPSTNMVSAAPREETGESQCEIDACPGLDLRQAEWRVTKGPSSCMFPVCSTMDHTACRRRGKVPSALLAVFVNCVYKCVSVLWCMSLHAL